MLSQQASDSDSETSTTSHKVDAPSAPLTKRDLKDMLTEMKSLVAEELTKHLAPLKEGLTDLTKRTQALENKMEEVTATTSTHEASIKELQEQFTYLEDMQEDLNNRSRRNNIRIRGLPEPSTPEALTAILHEAFSSLLPDALPSDLLLDRAHRALRPPSSSPTQPRDIIIRCHYFHIKEAIMRATRETPLQIEGHTVQLYHDLAPTTLRKRRELKPLTQALQAQGIRYSWGHPFKLMVRHNNRTFTLTKPSEARDFAAQLGISDLNGALHTASQQPMPQRRPWDPQPQRDRTRGQRSSQTYA
ncbi:Hypothetical predicted protein [Pelobates cultripes]|nr:Hypothetical predicted protein [Pelobates cultripes]